MQLVKAFILAAAVTSAASALPIGTKAWERDMVGDEVVWLAARNPPGLSNLLGLTKDKPGQFTGNGPNGPIHKPKEEVVNPQAPGYSQHDPNHGNLPGYTPGAHNNPPPTPPLQDVGNLLGHGGNGGNGHSARDVVGDEVVWLAARNPLWSKLFGGGNDKPGYFTGPGGTHIPKQQVYNPPRPPANSRPPTQDLSNLLPPPGVPTVGHNPPPQDLSILVPPGSH